MVQQRDDAPKLDPRLGDPGRGENGFELTEEDEAILDRVWADLADEIAEEEDGAS